MSDADEIAARWIVERHFHRKHPLFAAREAELQREYEARQRSKQMRALLGTRQFGPFNGIDVTRASDETITACRTVT